jgi:hypothetical protein
VNKLAEISAISVIFWQSVAVSGIVFLVRFIVSRLANSFESALIGTLRIDPSVSENIHFERAKI